MGCVCAYVPKWIGKRTEIAQLVTTFGLIIKTQNSL